MNQVTSIFNSMVQKFNGTKHIGSAKKPTDFFHLMFKPVLWGILVEETNRYAITPQTGKML